jgi:hypothetical protein
MTQNSVKIILFKGWLLKDNQTFVVKESWYEKLQREKRSCVKNCRSSPLNEAGNGLVSQA